MTTSLRFVGWLLLAASIGASMRAWVLERRLRLFRRPQAPRWKYYVVPLHLQEDLYHGEGVGLVGRIWRTLGLMFAFGIIGALFLSYAQ